MNLLTAPYLFQNETWPKSGRYILAQYDTETIVVYQAYNSVIGHWAVAHQTLGGNSFSFDRMSWIKPNFLWMMYRSGWGTKPNQEVTLAIRLKRTGFDRILAEAVPSTFIRTLYPDEKAWKAAGEHSAVRMQWDPDHHPSGSPLERRAIQLGLREESLKRYADEWIVSIEDISAFVAEQRQHIKTAQYDKLTTPLETIYSVQPTELAVRIGLTQV